MVALAVVVSIALGACDSPAGGTPDDAAGVAILPVGGFADSSSMARAVVLPGSGLTESEIKWFLMAPAVTSFEKNALGVGSGDSYTFPFLGTTVTMNVSVSGSVVAYASTLPDNGGYIDLVYDTSAGTFDYEQMIHVDNSSGALASAPADMVVYTKMRDAVVDPATGYFQGTFEAFAWFPGSPGGMQSTHHGEVYYGAFGSTSTDTTDDSTFPSAKTTVAEGIGVAFFYGDTYTSLDSAFGANVDVAELVNGGAYEVGYNAMSFTPTSDGPYLMYRDIGTGTIYYPDYGNSLTIPTTLDEFKTHLPESWAAATNLTELP